MERAEKTILGVVVTGIVASIIIAMFISPFASVFPDGLEKVAENLGFIDRATSVISEDFFIIPDYTFSYVRNENWQGPLAGLFGVLIITVFFGIIFLIYKAATRRESTKINSIKSH